MSPMRCEDLQEIFRGDRGDDLDQATAQELEEHLERCADCRAHLAEAEDQLAPLAASFAAPQPSAADWDRVTQAVSAELSGRPVIAFPRAESSARSAGRTSGARARSGGGRSVVPALLALAAAVLLLVGVGALLSVPPGGAPGIPRDAGGTATVVVPAPMASELTGTELLSVEAGAGYRAESQRLESGLLCIVVEQDS